MQESIEEIRWLNVRLTRTRDGYALIFTDTMALCGPDWQGRFKVVGHFHEEIFGDILGKVLSEINEIPYINETKTGAELLESDDFREFQIGLSAGLLH